VTVGHRGAIASGGGYNALVTAIELVRAGWRRVSRAGAPSAGAVMSAPGRRSDREEQLGTDVAAPGLITPVRAVMG
jgi:hypothetical protein